MKPRFFRRPWVLFTSIIVIGICMIFGAGIFARSWLKQKSDLGNKPPTQVFAQIFQMPAPAGVSIIKAAGESSLSGVFWMRMKTNNINAVISALKRNSKVPLTGPRSDLAGSVTPRDVANSYAASVGWSKALLIKKPEYYEFSTKPFGTGWAGILIVDRAQNIIYARGDLY